MAVSLDWRPVVTIRAGMNATQNQFESFSDFYCQSEYSSFEQQLRCAGSFDLNILDVRQKAIESCDPAISEFPIVMCNDGGGSSEIDFGDGWKRRMMRPGFVDVQPADQTCYFRIPDIDLRIIFVKKQQLQKCLQGSPFEVNDICRNSGVFAENHYAASLISQIWTASTIHDPARNLIVDGLFLQLVAELLADDKGSPLAAPLKAIGDVRLKRVIEYVEDNIAEPLSLETLAQVACMSISHFTRCFKTATGRSVWNYVQHRRCSRAYNLLTKTRMPIAIIAHECGFANQAYFTTVFRNETGQTPGAIRR